MIRRIGDYELSQELGRGAVGVVYRARQISLGRFVAVKILRDSSFADPEHVRRFRVEAASLAQLQHPAIVPIIEFGEVDGEFFMAMAVIDGPNLAQVVAETPPDPVRAAKLMVSIAEGIQHAHSRGILHRDLKPANVLLESADHPLITDFGMAKRLDIESSLTATGQVLGTPAYMAPEQAADSPLLGLAADIYGMGAILYHLLTGRPPFVGSSISDVLIQVAKREPVSPKALNPSIPEALECICLKCLRKAPSQRYASASEFAEDLRRFLDGMPTLARPLNPLERFASWCRREPIVASLSALGALLLVVTLMVSWAAHARLKNSARHSKELLLQSEIARSSLERSSGKFGSRFRALDAIQESLQMSPRPLEPLELRSAAATHLLDSDLQFIEIQDPGWELGKLLHLNQHLNCLALPDGRMEVSIGRDQRLTFPMHWYGGVPEPTADGRWLVVPTVSDVAFARLATNSTTIRIRGTRAIHSTDSRWALVLNQWRTMDPPTLLDLQDRQRIRIPGGCIAAAFSPDSRWLAIAQERQILLRDLNTGKTIQPLAWPSTGLNRPLQFSRDSKYLATVIDPDATLVILSMESLESFLPTLPLSDASSHGFAGSDASITTAPDLRQLLATNLAGQEFVHPVRALSWSPSANRLLTANRGVVEIDMDRRAIRVPPFPIPSKDRWISLSTTSDGRFLAMKDSSDSLAVVETAKLTKLGSWTGIAGESVSWSGTNLIVHRPEGRGAETRAIYRFAASDVLAIHRIRIPADSELHSLPGKREGWSWVDREGWKTCRPDEGTIQTVVPLPDATAIVIRGDSHQVAWSTSTNILFGALDPANMRLDSTRPVSRWTPMLPGESIEPGSLQLSNDGRIAATITRTSLGQYLVNAWEVASSKLPHQIPTSSQEPRIALSPDGKWIVVLDNGARRYRVGVSGEDYGLLNEIDGGHLVDVEFSPEGRWIALGSLEGTTLLDARTWRRTTHYPASGLSADQISAAFSPGGRWLASWKSDHRLQIIDLASRGLHFEIDLPFGLKAGKLRFGPASQLLHVHSTEAYYTLDIDRLDQQRLALGRWTSVDEVDEADSIQKRYAPWSVERAVQGGVP